MANSYPKVWKKIKGITIAPGDTNVADLLPTQKVNSLKYLIDARRDSSDSVRSLEIIVTRVGGQTQDSVLGRRGSALNISVESQINGSNLELLVTNNESFNIQLSMARAIV